MEKILIQYYHSPYGGLVLGSFSGRLCLCDWAGERRRAVIGGRMRRMLHAGCEEGASGVVAEAAAQLDAYFARDRRVFDVPLLLVGTEFQQSVWRELLKIPYGAALSYGELSRRLGRPEAVRAVAAANGANALSIFVPCHRVVGGDGRLTGYAGGLEAKKGLLDLENPLHSFS